MAAAPPRSGCAPQRHRPSAAELSPRSSPRRRFLHRTSHSSRPERWNWRPACRCPNPRYLPRYRLSCRWSRLIRASGHSPRGPCLCLYRFWRSRRCPRGTFRPGAAVQALAEARGRGCVTGATAAWAAVTAATATQQASGEFVQSATQAVIVVVVVARSAAGFCVRGRRGDGENPESPMRVPELSTVTTAARAEARFSCWLLLLGFARCRPTANSMPGICSEVKCPSHIVGPFTSCFPRTAEMVAAETSLRADGNLCSACHDHLNRSPHPHGAGAGRRARVSATLATR